MHVGVRRSRSCGRRRGAGRPASDRDTARCRGPLRLLLVRAALATIAVCVPLQVALAQGAAADPRQAAERAREAAAAAQRDLEAAQADLEAAQQRVADRTQEAEALADQAAAEAPVAEASPDPVEAARKEAAEASERAERAERRANQADRRAREALERVEALEGRLAYDRTGFYVGGMGFYAPEVFDEGSSVSVKSSTGASARIGYRLHPAIAVDVRFDYLDGFDVFSGNASGKIDGYAITGNFRAFLYPGRIQPWVGMGVGAIVSDFDAQLDDGTEIDTRGTETDPIFRFGAGFDTYLSSSLVLSVDFGMNVVADDRDFINYGQLGVGLDYRF